LKFALAQDEDQSMKEAKRLRTLEDENAKLKRLLADAMLDNAALKDLLGKKW
jgi:putative transposase